MINWLASIESIVASPYHFKHQSHTERNFSSSSFSRICYHFLSILLIPWAYGSVWTFNKYLTLIELPLDKSKEYLTNDYIWHHWIWIQRVFQKKKKMCPPFSELAHLTPDAIHLSQILQMKYTTEKWINLAFNWNCVEVFTLKHVQFSSIFPLFFVFCCHQWKSIFLIFYFILFFVCSVCVSSIL